MTVDMSLKSQISRLFEISLQQNESIKLLEKTLKEILDKQEGFSTEEVRN